MGTGKFFLRGLVSFGLLAWIGFVAGGCGGGDRVEVHRVGILCGLSAMADVAGGFKERMAELGYSEGKNIVYDLQTSEFDMENYRKILKGFIDRKMDLIFSFPTEASVEARLATEGTGLPVVFAVANIENMNIVDSVRKPGGNVTGVRYPGPDIALKRLEIMHEMAPWARRYLITYQKGYPTMPGQLEVLRPAAAKYGITLVECPTENIPDLKSLFQRRSASGDIGVDAVLLLPEPMSIIPESFIASASFAADHKIPIGGSPTSAGGFHSAFGLHISDPLVGRQAAGLADKILRGTPPSRVPVVSAESFFSVNVPAARKQGLKLDKGLLDMADKVEQ